MVMHYKCVIFTKVFLIHYTLLYMLHARKMMCISVCPLKVLSEPSNAAYRSENWPGNKCKLIYHLLYTATAHTSWMQYIKHSMYSIYACTMQPLSWHNAYMYIKTCMPRSKVVQVIVYVISCTTHNKGQIVSVGGVHHVCVPQLVPGLCHHIAELHPLQSAMCEGGLPFLPG